MEFSMEKPPSNMIPSITRGLSILLVDHDTTSLLRLASMLEQYSYEVTTTEQATVAMSLIREQNDRFELVMADIHIPDVDSLEFVHILTTSGIPVILMSTERSLSIAYKALMGGACFHMQKPICFDDLKYVWQHAYSKKKGYWRNETLKQESLKRMSTGKESRGINVKVAASRNNNGKKSEPEVIRYQLSVNNPFKGKNKQAERGENIIVVADNDVPVVKIVNTNTDVVFVAEGQRNEESNMNEHGQEGRKEKRMKSESELPPDDRNKSKEIEEKENNQNLHSSCGTTTTGRKPRLVWTQELHLKFIAAISALGDEYARPKAILKKMNVANLTQRQVASHLQKYKAQVQRICPNSTNNSPPPPLQISNSSALTGSSHSLDNSKSVLSQLGHSSYNFITGGTNGYPNLPKEVLPNSTLATGLFYQDQQFPSLHQNLNVTQGFTYAINSQHQDQQLLNLQNNVLQQINLSPDSAVTSSQFNQNRYFMTSTQKTRGQDFFPAQFTSSNVSNMAYSLSDILTGIAEVEATPIMTLPTLSEGQNQWLPQFDELLKLLEEEGVAEPHPGDVDRYYQSLRDVLFGDNEQSYYGW